MPVNSNRHFGVGQGSTTGGLQVPLSLSDLDRLVLLHVSAVGGVADDYVQLLSLNKNIAGQFQVPSGKALYILTCNTSPTGVLVGYGDTALGANRTATPPTNPVYLAASSTTYSNSLWAATAHMVSFSVHKIPAGKYPFIRTSNTGGFTNQFGCILLDE